MVAIFTGSSRVRPRADALPRFEFSFREGVTRIKPFFICRLGLKTVVSVFIWHNQADFAMTSTLKLIAEAIVLELALDHV